MSVQKTSYGACAIVVPSPEHFLIHILLFIVSTEVHRSCGLGISTLHDINKLRIRIWEYVIGLNTCIQQVRFGVAILAEKAGLQPNICCFCMYTSGCVVRRSVFYRIVTWVFACTPVDVYSLGGVCFTVL